MTFQFLFSFTVSAEGFSSAVASKTAGQAIGSPGFLAARLHVLHGQAGLCGSSSLFAFSSRQATWATHATIN